MTPVSGSLLDALPSKALAGEVLATLVERPGVRIERIVSTGQATPEGEWYDQAEDEWVLVLKGRARLSIAGETQERTLGEGDYLLLPAHCRHRVTWTQAQPPTVWLAVHFGRNQ